MLFECTTNEQNFRFQFIGLVQWGFGFDYYKYMLRSANSCATQAFLQCKEMTYIFKIGLAKQKLDFVQFGE